MDKQSPREEVQGAIRATCHPQTEAHRRSYLSQLQSSSSAVSVTSMYREDVDLRCEFLCRELSSTFARLCRVVDNAQSDMGTELKEIENSLNILEANQKQIKLLRNKASYITNKLDTFENNYIKSN
jgi:fzo-like conserved region